MRNELWQGCFSYWQNRFIQQNILPIGYTAWNGYLNTGKGMIDIRYNSPRPRWQVITFTLILHLGSLHCFPLILVGQPLVTSKPHSQR